MRKAPQHDVAPTEILKTLIPTYYANKSEMDQYKKITDRENTQIKEAMANIKQTEYVVGDIVAKVSTQRRESMNEEKLLEVCHIEGIPEVVKTREYVDMDLLEKAIYDGKISQEILLKMDKCKDIKEVVTLKVTKKKKEKETE
jgi:hypothetical protein